MTAHIAGSSETRNQLAHLRCDARKRAFRILGDWEGTFLLSDIKIEAPRKLTALADLPLEEIASALLMPLAEWLPRWRETKWDALVSELAEGPPGLPKLSLMQLFDFVMTAPTATGGDT